MRRKIYTKIINNLIIPLESFQHERNEVDGIELNYYKDNFSIYKYISYNYSNSEKIINFKLVDSIISFKSKNIKRSVNNVVDIGYYSNFLNFFDFKKYIFQYIKNIKYLCIGKTNNKIINDEIKKLFINNNYEVIDDIHHAYKNGVYYIIKN